MNDASSAPATDQSGNRIALTAVTFATGLAFAGWTVLGPLGPGLQQNLRIDDARLGLLMALPVLIGSVLRLPVGLLADRFGGRRTLVALTRRDATTTGLDGHEPRFLMSLLVSAILLGIAGSSFAAGVRFVEARFPQRRHGFALGVYGVAVAGTVATALVMPRLAQRYGLTTAFYVLAGATVASWAIFVGFTRSAPGATMKLLAQRFDAELGSAAGVVGAAGGFGGFVPPLLLATMVSSDGGYGLPFLGLGVMACVCLVIAWRDGSQREFANEVSWMRLAEKCP